MKNHSFKQIMLQWGIALWFLGPLNSLAQQTMPGTDIPRTLSYQGMLTDGKGSVENGHHSITLTFYADGTTSSPIWSGSYETTVTNGVFNILLGSRGTTPLPEPSQLDRPIWVGVSLDGGPVGMPLSQLSASLYAMNVPDNSITAAKIGTDYVKSISINGQKVTGRGSDLNIVSGDGVSLTYDNVANNIVLNSSASTENPNAKGAKAQIANGDGGSDWSETGNNSTTPGTNYVGTSDNKALEIHVNDGGLSTGGYKRVMRFEPATNSPNIIGGWNGNGPSGGTENGAFIGGGGVSGGPNTTGSDYTVVTGGNYNSINGSNSTGSVISGGGSNTIYGNSQLSTIAGGSFNSVGVSGGVDDYEYSVVGGGTYNIIKARNDVIAGGWSNTTNTTCNGKLIAIGGGGQNTATGYGSTIPGGYNLNTVNTGQIAMGFYNWTPASPSCHDVNTWAPTNSASYDDQLLMLGNGHAHTPTNVTHDAFEVSYNGHSTVFDLNGSSYSGTVGNRAVIKGSTYQDNIIYAWGDVPPSGTYGFGNPYPATSDFGVDHVVEITGGHFTIYLRVSDPASLGGAQTKFSGSSVVATLEGDQCANLIYTTPVTTGANPSFDVFTEHMTVVLDPTTHLPQLQCQLQTMPFMFHVCGEPSTSGY